MVSTSTLLATIALAASTAPTNAFTSVANNNNRGAALCATDPTQALSDYMIKSHDDKLRAVKDAENKKNSEIEALKAEIQQLKASSSLATTTPAAPLAEVPSSEIQSKLTSYQSFMAEYIVNAQTQKLLAVKEAELKAEQKFQERLEKLFEGSGMTLPSAGEVAAPIAVEETSFQSRNACIIAAGAAGKSRWGSAEIDRAIEEAKSAPKAATAAVEAEATVFEHRNAQVVAAGSKSRWGSMEVERAASGVGSASAAVEAPPEVEATVFEHRNAQVVAAGSKSRWGSMEVERAASGVGSASAAATAVVVEEKSVADVSLEDRINLGARMLGA